MEFKKNHWVLLKPSDVRRRMIVDTLYDYVVQTYAEIGGHAKISNPYDLEKYQYWIVANVDDDPDPDVIIAGSDDAYGTKLGLGANDGGSAAIAAYKNKSTSLRKGEVMDGIGNWWGELSGKPAYAMLSRGAPAVIDQDFVEELVGEIQWLGEHPDENAPKIFKDNPGWYVRKIGGKQFLKIIVGKPK